MVEVRVERQESKDLAGVDPALVAAVAAVQLVDVGVDRCVCDARLRRQQPLEVEL